MLCPICRRMGCDCSAHEVLPVCTTCGIHVHLCSCWMSTDRKMDRTQKDSIDQTEQALLELDRQRSELENEKRKLQSRIDRLNMKIMSVQLGSEELERR